LPRGFVYLRDVDATIAQDITIPDFAVFLQRMI
jgi:hypothetical protein